MQKLNIVDNSTAYRIACEEFPQLIQKYFDCIGYKPKKTTLKKGNYYFYEWINEHANEYPALMRAIRIYLVKEKLCTTKPNY